MPRMAGVPNSPGTGWEAKNNKKGPSTCFLVSNVVAETVSTMPDLKYGVLKGGLTGFQLVVFGAGHSLRGRRFPP